MSPIGLKPEGRTDDAGNNARRGMVGLTDSGKYPVDEPRLCGIVRGVLR
jgi:hypothetical protein